MSDLIQMQVLILMLNRYRESYYNFHQSIVSDKEYDKLYDELISLEIKTGTIYHNSPTVTVGYEVVSSLPKVKHQYPMLSLDKTKSIADIIRFANSKVLLAMLKLDGLTMAVTYKDGVIAEAETRGDGIEGYSVLHNALAIANLPYQISCTQTVIVCGEVIISYADFNSINNMLPPDEQYENPRNLASGSLQQLNSHIAATRMMQFIAWDCVQGLDTSSLKDTLVELQQLGFATTAFQLVSSFTELEIGLVNEKLVDCANQMDVPIDGLVFKYDDIPFGKSLGCTSHHSRAGLALKFKDDLHDTHIRSIQWSVGGTGVITPVAIFDPVFIEGNIERASLHNVSIMEELGLTQDCTVYIYKANQIIPQIDSCEQDGTKPFEIPTLCPACKEPTTISTTTGRKVLLCSNKSCVGRLIKLFSRFVGKTGMDIEGLSEATITTFVNLGWIKQFSDIYTLDQHSDEMRTMTGFGDKSVDNLLTAIQNSKSVTLDKFLVSFSIPSIGKSASKKIAQYCNYSIDKFFQCMEENFYWSNLEEIGDVQNSSLSQWYTLNKTLLYDLASKMIFIAQQSTVTNNVLQGAAFCITGSLQEYTNREELEQDIRNHGGLVVSGVSKKTNYLLTNDTTSGSSKNKKAEELNIPVITELQYKKMLVE